MADVARVTRAMQLLIREKINVRCVVRALKLSHLHFHLAPKYVDIPIMVVLSA